MDEPDLTVEILKTIQGGPELLAWFAGRPTFHDSEVVGLSLSRNDDSTLQILAIASAAGRDKQGLLKRGVVTFVLTDMVDVSIDGFSQQNVLGDLTLKRAIETPVHPTNIGVGLAQGDFEIELHPCFGAHGRIRATIASIFVETSKAAEIDSDF